MSLFEKVTPAIGILCKGYPMNYGVLFWEAITWVFSKLRLIQKSYGSPEPFAPYTVVYFESVEVNALDWSKLPDLAAVALLACAFASVSRRGQSSVSALWLTGWVMIVLHFGAFMFLPAPGVWGIIAADLGLVSLAGAGVLFMYASIPYRHRRSSIWMLMGILGTNVLYISLSNADPAAAWAMDPAAILLGVVPLALALVALPRVSHPLRWMMVAIYCALSVFLLLVQHRPGNGADLALNGLLFAAYFGSCLFFWYTYRRATAGALIIISGFLAWASVFLIAPWLQAALPAVRVESEVWNLPKYLVAVGMILVLLEDQIEHNKYLALHDDLTGLPNRRLFLDRLCTAVERARRTDCKAALLVVDLNNFKQVNDELGHHAGDLVLKTVAAIFAGRIRRSDTVARTGGDEFSIILEEPTSREQARQVAHSLMELLNKPLDVELEESVLVGASIGVAVFPDDAGDMESLCIAADLRMYDDKHGAKGISRPRIPARSIAQPLFQEALKAGSRESSN